MEISCMLKLGVQNRHIGYNRAHKEDLVRFSSDYFLNDQPQMVYGVPMYHLTCQRAANRSPKNVISAWHKALECDYNLGKATGGMKY